MNDTPKTREWVRMSDVAREAGVSAMTVSRAFSEPLMLTKETRAKVLDAAARLGYVPNLIAGNLASGRSKIVAAVVPSIRNSNFSSLLHGLSDQLSTCGYHHLVAIASGPEEELEIIWALMGRRPDGIILTGSQHHEELKVLLKRAGLCIVETWELEGPFIDSAVGFRTFDAARSMTELLIEKGYRRIGYADYDAGESKRFLERRRGFQAAMKAAGLRDDLIYSGPESLGFAGGRVAVEKLVQREPRLDALFCVTDIFAAGAMLECIRRNWNVPGRLAIAGFGDFELGSEIPPGLTTVRTHGYQIGQSAANIIFARIDDPQAKPTITDVGYEIVVRGST